MTSFVGCKDTPDPANMSASMGAKDPLKDLEIDRLNGRQGYHLRIQHMFGSMGGKSPP